jgi:hypothetical protein
MRCDIHRNRDSPSALSQSRSSFFFRGMSPHLHLEKSESCPICIRPVVVAFATAEKASAKERIERMLRGEEVRRCCFKFAQPFRKTRDGVRRPKRGTIEFQIRHLSNRIQHPEEGEKKRDRGRKKKERPALCSADFQNLTFLPFIYIFVYIICLTYT